MPTIFGIYTIFGKKYICKIAILYLFMGFFLKKYAYTRINIFCINHFLILRGLETIVLIK